MNLYEIPPNNSLFSRRWLHRAEMNSEGYQKVIQDNIDSTNRKLEDLEQWLQTIQGIEEKWTPVPDHYTKVLSTIGFLKKHIGTWRTGIYPPFDNLLIRMMYPNTSGISSWDSDILGPIVSTPSDVCVVMLSDKAVTWLNGLRILHKTVDPSFYSTASF